MAHSRRSSNLPLSPGWYRLGPTPRLHRSRLLLSAKKHRTTGAGSCTNLRKRRTAPQPGRRRTASNPLLKILTKEKSQSPPAGGWLSCSLGTPCLCPCSAVAASRRLRRCYAHRCRRPRPIPAPPRPLVSSLLKKLAPRLADPRPWDTFSPWETPRLSGPRSGPGSVPYE